MADVALIVAGKRYGGWKSVRVTRSMESLAGSFDLEVSDRWSGQDVPWPIREEDACRVEIDGEPVIEGYVDKRNHSLSAGARSLRYSGRDRAAALVDCSAVLKQWTFRKASVQQVAETVAAPFGIKVALQPGLVLPKPPPKIAISPGDSAFSAIERAAQAAGVMVVSDGAGGILITRSGTARAASLVEGVNIQDASVSYDAADRFHRYIVVTQVAGTDEASGGATRIRAEAIDRGVKRTDRVLLVRPESGITTDYARRRGDWEARIRAARAGSATIVVRGWRQPDGELWPLNALTILKCPSIGIDGEVLISQVDYQVDGAGERASIRVVRPDAFTPEPQAVVRIEGRWKELADGGR